MHVPPTAYIPVGTIRLAKEQTSISDVDWAAVAGEPWKPLIVHDESNPSSRMKGTDGQTGTQPQVQAQLLRTKGLGAISRLFHAGWLRLEFLVVSASDAVLRVFLLPDDVQRRAINRSNISLQNSRATVLQQLDYSKSSWNISKESWSDMNTSTDVFTNNSAHTKGPVPYDLTSAKEEDITLLQLFNRIPSPKPDPQSVVDGYARDGMLDLLEGKVAGLKSELYPYQRRSAALMLQKEMQPGRVLDPRLLRVLDQNDASWYLDSVAGSVLLEPRYYDGAPGGILAEEMGAGKTIMCLALILATRDLPTPAPDIYGPGDRPTRGRIASLADMAASCATRNALPWKAYFDVYKEQLGLDFDACIETLKKNPGYYYLPAPEPRRSGRYPQYQLGEPKKIYTSSCSLVIVPNNLLAQWKHEIRKHTEDLEVLILAKNEVVPEAANLLQYNIIIIAQSRFEKIVKFESGMDDCPLSEVHFSRCIVDEGHKLGNSRIGNKSVLLLGLNSLHISARWVVTGTPSHGLFGVDDSKTDVATQNGNGGAVTPLAVNESSLQMEKKDLERIGSIAALYLKARPWANTSMDTGDTVADWSTYLLLPKHNPKSRGRWDCLRTTLNSLIVRHQLSEVGDLLPAVTEKVVVLEGSYQDQLSLNLFSMMIIFNSVQSQRTDMDYFFHPKQKKSLLQIVHNLKQTSFFGGSFFSPEDISKSITTAEEFLEEKKVPINPDDEVLLRQAIDFGRLAVDNKLRNLSNQFHEMPVVVEEFPGGAGGSWSLDNEDTSKVCTSASMLLALQKLVYACAADVESLNSLMNGGLIQQGRMEREKTLISQDQERSPSAKEKKVPTLAGNTKLGDDSPKKSRSHGVNGMTLQSDLATDGLPGQLQATQITATTSAKLSYLIDGIVRHQDDEKIIVFYENDNVAWYLASMLDVLQIQHLIYAKGLTTERRAQYVNTFHHNETFRVLLMDLSQAAFGLDIRAASRIYFINPVLNPQVEAQAIGRVRRVNQEKPVSVETLVLKGSIDEVLLERKQHMTQAEHRQVKSILDIRPIYNWIKNTTILPMPELVGEDKISQMATLGSPLRIFSKGFGRPLHPDEGLVSDAHHDRREPVTPVKANGVKRPHADGVDSVLRNEVETLPGMSDIPSRPARRVRFAAGSDED